MGRNRRGIKKINAAHNSSWNSELKRSMQKNLRIARVAVHNAQEENRQLGIPNWYSIDGKIVRESDMAHKNITHQ